MNCQACGLFIANKVYQCPRCGQVLIKPPTGSTGSQEDVSLHANVSHNISPGDQPVHRRSGALRSPARTLLRRPGIPLAAETTDSQAEPLAAAITPLPIQKPVFQPLPPAQLSPADGSRRAKFVEQRHNKNQGSARLILFAGLSVCVLLVLILGSYLLLQNFAQPDDQAGQTKKAYPTAVPTSLPLTNTDPQELYQHAIKRKTLLADPLKTQSSYDWEAVNTDGSCTFEDQQLHLSSIQGGKAILCLEQALTFDNFAFQAQMTLLQGDTGGLLIRANTAGNQLYMFGLTTSGRYLLASVQQPTGSQPQILTGGLSSAIKQSTNQLTIIARQHTFYLYINGRYLTEITDPTISSGEIGLFAGDSQQNIPDATFSNARVWGV